MFKIELSFDTDRLGQDVLERLYARTDEIRGLSGKRTDSNPGSVRGRFHGEEAEEDHAQCAGFNHDPIPGHAGDLPGGHAGNRPNYACGGVKAGDRGGAPGPSALWNQRFPHWRHLSPACNHRASSYVHHDRNIPFGQYRV